MSSISIQRISNYLNEQYWVCIATIKSLEKKFRLNIIHVYVYMYVYLADLNLWLICNPFLGLYNRSGVEGPSKRRRRSLSKVTRWSNLADYSRDEKKSDMRRRQKGGG